MKVTKRVKRATAAEIRYFLEEILKEIPTTGRIASSVEVDDLMYRQKFMIDGMMYDIIINDMRGATL